MKLNVGKKNAIFILTFLIAFIKEINSDVIYNPKKILTNIQRPAVFLNDTFYYISVVCKLYKVGKNNGEIEQFFNTINYSSPYIGIIDKYNDYYLLSKKIYFKLDFSSGIQNISNLSFGSLQSSPNGYIQEHQSNGESGGNATYCLYPIVENEIIVYGIYMGNYIYFSYFKSGNKSLFYLQSNINQKISCKVLASGQYLCAFTTKSYIAKATLIKKIIIIVNNFI